MDGAAGAIARGGTIYLLLDWGDNGIGPQAGSAQPILPRRCTAPRLQEDDAALLINKSYWRMTAVGRIPRT